MNTAPTPINILALERPDPVLWKLYVLRAILSGPLMLILLPVLYFRYHTLRYRFDAEGVHMKVGWLFRREVNLTYARIQDIHLNSGILQRWLGLADVQVQTASGSSGAELVIEGFKEFEAIRDFLYTKMRGYHAHPTVAAISPAAASHLPSEPVSAPDEAIIPLLRAIRDELRQTRESLAARPAPPPSRHA